MSAESIDAIDKAVRAHFAEILSEIDTRPITTAWVIVAEVQTLEDGEIMWDNAMATGETTSPNTALGLSVWLGDELREIRGTYDEEDEDGDNN